MPTNDRPNVEVLNGEKITDLSAAKRALSYLKDGYNNGDVYEAEGGRCLVVISRTARFQHFQLFQRAEGVRVTNTVAVDRSERREEPDLRLKVELRDANGGEGE